MHEPGRVEAIDGIHTVEPSPADDWDLEGYILACGKSFVMIDTGFTPYDPEAYKIELKAMGDIEVTRLSHGMNLMADEKRKVERLCAPIQG